MTATPVRGRRSASLTIAAMLLLGGCAGPRVPDWQFNAKNALDRAVQAHLSGDTRVDAAEIANARQEISRTGRVDLTARVELTYCAARVAGLAFDACAGFEPLRKDAPAAERAYADYLEGRVEAADIPLLPPPHRAIAAAATPTAAQLESIEDPLARAVAAAVLLRTARADPSVVAAAVETSSAQGWRRPLLGWLKIQLALAEKADASAEVERVRRRIAIVQGELHSNSAKPDR